MPCNFQEKVSLVSSSRIIGGQRPERFSKGQRSSTGAHEWNYWPAMRQWHRSHPKYIWFLEGDGDVTPTGLHPYQISSSSLDIPPGGFTTPERFTPPDLIRPIRLPASCRMEQLLPEGSCFHVDYTRFVSLKAICVTLTGIWAGGLDTETASVERAQVLVKKSRQDAWGLLGWLDWDILSGCRPACAPDASGLDLLNAHCTQY